MIDIIILTKDHLALTKKCIESIRTKYPYELIVVDSGSTDGTQEYLDLKGALVIPTKGEFCFSRNVNIGVKFGKNPLKLICNNDIQFGRKAIDAMVETMITEKAGMVGPHSNACMNPDQWHKGPQDPDETKETTRTLNFFAVLIDNKVFETIGYMDKQFTGYGCDDDDFTLRAYKAGYKIMVAPAYVYHEATATYKELDKKKMYRENIKRFKDKWGFAPTQDWRECLIKT